MKKIYLFVILILLIVSVIIIVPKNYDESLSFGGCFNHCLGSETFVKENYIYRNTCHGIIIQDTCGSIFSEIYLNIFGVIHYVKEGLI